MEGVPSFRTSPQHLGRGALALGGIVVAVTLLLAAPTAEAATNVSGTIAADTTWSFVNSPYVVTGTVTVSGSANPKLTIEPGVQVLFNSNTQLVVGGTGSTNLGTLIARGTEASPILFSSNQINKTRGFWSGVTFNNFANDTLSFVENVTVEYAGANGFSLTSAEPTVRNATFRESSTFGLRVTTANPTLLNVVFANNTQYGATIPSGGNPIFVNAVFRGNGLYGLHTANGIPELRNATFNANGARPMRVHVESRLEDVRLEGEVTPEIELVATPNALLTKDRTLSPLTDLVSGAPVPYVLVESFTIRGNDGADGVTTWTLAPGTELRVNSGRTITVAGTSAGQVGALDARGTASAPVLLTSNQTAGAKTRGFWGGVTFNDFANDSLSYLENVTIEYAGGSANLYLIRAEPTIRACTLREGSGIGARIDVANTLFTECVFANNTQHGVSIPSGGAPRFVASTFSGNGQYGLNAANGIPLVEGSRFAQNGQRPARIHADTRFLGNTLDRNAIQEVEIMATPNSLQTVDVTRVPLTDETNGTAIPYVVTASYTVRGTDGPDGVTTLTLQPGVLMRFASGIRLDVSSNTAGQVAAFDARGTAEDPIVLGAATATPTRGFWRALRLFDFTNDSLSYLENVTIEHAGGDGYSLYLYRNAPTIRSLTVREGSAQGIYLDEAPVTVADSLVANHSANGVYFRGAPTTSTLLRSTLSGNAQNGVYTESGTPNVLDSVLLGNTQRPLRLDVDSRLLGNAYEANGIQEIELIGGNNLVDTDQILPAAYDRVNGTPVPYVMANTVRIQGTAGEDGLTTLTVEPGAHLRFRSQTQLVVGGSSASVRGGLVARGTEAAPVLFGSAQAAGAETAGFWRNVYFDDGADRGSFFENVTLAHAGFGFDGALHLDRAGPLVVRNLHMLQAAGHGIESFEIATEFRGVRVEGGGASGAYAVHLTSGSVATRPTVDGLDVVDWNGKPLYTSPDARLADIAAQNVTVPQIDVAAQTASLDATWPAVFDAATGGRVHYAFSGTLTVLGNDGADNTTTLTLEPGVEVRLGSWSTRLVIAGSSGASSGALDARGTEALPILFTSWQAPGSRNPGDWGRIDVFDGANDSLTALENVTIEYGGGYWNSGSLYIERAFPTLRNLSITDSAIYGLSLYAAPVDITGGLFARNGAGADPGYGIYTDRGNPRATERMELTGIRFEDNLGRTLRVPPDALLTDLTFRNSVETDEIDRYGDYLSYDTTWTQLHDEVTGAKVVNLITGWITVATRDHFNASHLTVAPGTDVEFWSGGLEIGDPWLYDTTASRFAYGNWSATELGLRFLNGTQPEGGCEDVLPDVLGYTCAVIPYAFEDVNATGTQVTLSDDQVSGAVPLGFNFTFYGRNYSSAYISSNGFLSFNNYWDDGCCSGQDLPDPGTPNNLVAGYWEDLDPRLGGNIAYQTLGSAPDRRFILQYTSIQHYTGGNPTTFQIVLRENGHAAEVHLQTAASDGGWHVAGVESDGILAGLGKITAEGTPSEPIRFLSGQAVRERGDWGGFYITEAALTDSIIANATIEDAYEGIYAYQGEIVVRDTTIRHSETEGVYLDMAPMRLERVTIEDTGEGDPWDYGVYVYPDWGTPDRAELVDVVIRNNNGTGLAIGADTLLQNVTFQNNTREVIEVSYGLGTRDGHWAIHRAADTNAQLPYVLTDYAYVAGQDGADGVTTLTIDPGVEVIGQSWGGLVVGDYWDGMPGAIDARGTAAQPIRFRGEVAERGHWYAIEFAQTTDDARSFLANVTLEDGGSGRWGALYVYDAAPSVDNVTVRNSDTIGIYLDDAPTHLRRTTVEDTSGTFAYGVYASPNAGGMRLEDVTIRGTLGKPLAMPADAWLERVTLDANSRDEVDLWGGEVTHDARWQGLRDVDGNVRVPYLADADVDVLGATLHVVPDAEVRFAEGATMRIGSASDPLSGGALDARGTTAQPILFTSAQPEGIRTPGWWSRVEFLDGSDDGASRMENVTVEFAGSGDLGGVRLDRAAPSLRGNVLSRNGGLSIHASEAHGAQLHDNVLRRSTTGLFLADSSGVSLRNNSVSASLDPAYLTNVSGASILRNRFASADGVVQLLAGSTGNTLLDNNFTREMGGSPVIDDGVDNVWTTAPAAGLNVVGGPNRAGNYYSDYAGFDLTDPSDGIGDTGLPYLIAGTAGAGDLFPIVTANRWQSVEGAPETVAQLLGHLTESGWYNGTVHVQLTAFDLENDSFVIRASVDGQSFAEYTSPIPVAGDGYHTVDYYAQDSTGHTESLKRVTFRLDGTPPAASVVADESILDDLCFTLDASDAVSGLAELRYSVLEAGAGGGYVTNATGVVLAGLLATPGERVCADLAHEGSFVARAIATDRVGRVSVVETPAIVVDIEAPTVEIVAPQPRHVVAGPLSLEAPQAPARGATTSAEGAHPSQQGRGAGDHFRRADQLKPHLPRPAPARVAPPTVEAPELPDLERGPVVVATADVVAEAADAGSGIALGELWIDGALAANATASPGAREATFTWTIGPGLTVGWHNLTVVAYDGAGHAATATLPFYFLGADPSALPAPPPLPPPPAAAPAVPAPLPLPRLSVVIR